MTGRREGGREGGREEGSHGRLCPFMFTLFSFVDLSLTDSSTSSLPLSSWYSWPSTGWRACVLVPDETAERGCGDFSSDKCRKRFQGRGEREEEENEENEEREEGEEGSKCTSELVITNKNKTNYKDRQ